MGEKLFLSGFVENLWFFQKQYGRAFKTHTQKITDHILNFRVSDFEAPKSRCSISKNVGNEFNRL